MKSISLLNRLSILATMASVMVQAANVPPEIRNLKVQQRPGTYLVDVTFDLVDPDSLNGVFLSLEASSDNGANFNLPVKSVAGDNGLIKPGTEKRIVWNAFKDWPDHLAENAKIRIVARDTLPLGPFGIAPIDYQWIPPGRFYMGSPNSELEWWLANEANENLHEVIISKGFWICNHEVTQSEYKAVVGSNPSYFKGDNLPVEQISWNQANDFAQRLTSKSQMSGALPLNYTYRLPTEAEWEYSCRAGSKTAFAGDPSKMCWNVKNSGGKTSEVKSRLPNDYGLYDMHGNVWEFCSDWYGVYSLELTGDPTGPDFGSVRVIRGGSWNDFETLARSANRTLKRDGDPNYYHGIPPNGANNYTGLRLVISLK
jgi:formylglycine-generating enzyme required for sulfatase activity